MVDVVRDLGIQVAERIVGERRDVQDGVDSFEVSRVDAANVGADRGNVDDAGAERAGGVEVAVEADDVVSRGQQHRNHDGADVSEVSGDENPHAVCRRGAYDPLTYEHTAGVQPSRRFALTPAAGGHTVHHTPRPPHSVVDTVRFMEGTVRALSPFPDTSLSDFLHSGR